MIIRPALAIVFFLATVTSRGDVPATKSASTTPAVPVQGRLAVRIYTQARITFKTRQYEGVYTMRSWVEHGQSLWDDVHFGSAFALASEDKTYLITAAHTIQCDEADAKSLFGARKLPGEFVSFEKAEVRIRVSSLAFKPVRILMDKEADTAVMEMPPEFWDKVRLTPLVPGDASTLRVAQAIQILGYPGTATMDMKDLKVSDTSGAKITLNDRIDPGFSGGPAVDAANTRVIGLIARSTDKQGFCVPINAVLNVVRRFPKESLECDGAVALPLSIKPREQ